MKAITGISLLLLTTTFYSCQKVINVDLNSSAPKYVIEGSITDQPGPYMVKITKSVNFDQDNIFPGVSNAKVAITDLTAHITDTLSEISAGNYQTHILTGVPGHTYSLVIVSENNNFSATSTMPQPVSLDSVYTKKSAFGKNIDVVPVYKDPTGTGNYFHLLLTIKDSLSQDIYIHNDQITDGQEVSEELNNNIDVHSGDPITVELQCIDPNVFQYYRDLQQTIRQNSATPANPQGNITGGALGYFSANTTNKKTIVAP